MIIEYTKNVRLVTKKAAQISAKVKVSVKPSQRLAGVKGAASPLSLSADSEIPFIFTQNGARGEKCDSISRGSDHDRSPF